jgi:hypothetical protein
VGAAAAILVVAVAVPVLRTQFRPAPEGTTADPAPVENVERLPVVAQRAEPFVTDIDFVDRRHGFALRTHGYDSAPRA